MNYIYETTGDYMSTSIKIDWKKYFGWSEDFLESKNRKAEKSKRSWNDLSDLINDSAKPIIDQFASYGEKYNTSLYGKDYDNDIGMSIFLHSLSSWEGNSNFLVDFVDELYDVSFLRRKKEYSLDSYLERKEAHFDPLQVDMFALLSRLPNNISKKAKELLYKDFTPRVHYLASKVKEKFLYEDLISACWELLFCDVIYKYKPDKGHFATYATISMSRRITKYINAQGMVKIDDRSMKRRRERGETTFINRDYGLSLNSEKGYTLESHFADQGINVEDEALNRIELERAERILEECREILRFPDKCDLSIGRYLKYKGYAYPGVESKNTREIAEEEYVSIRAIQISVKTAVTKIAELAEDNPVLLNLIDMNEYKVLISKKEEQKKKRKKPKSLFPEDEGWLPL